MNLNDQIYNALRKVPDISDEQAQRAAAEFAPIDAETRAQFHSLDKRWIRVETMQYVTFAVSIAILAKLFIG
jgi:hypothetical protein